MRWWRPQKKVWQPTRHVTDDELYGYDPLPFAPTCVEKGDDKYHDTKKRPWLAHADYQTAHMACVADSLDMAKLYIAEAVGRLGDINADTIELMDMIRGAASDLADVSMKIDDVVATARMKIYDEKGE